MCNTKCNILFSSSMSQELKTLSHLPRSYQDAEQMPPETERVVDEPEDVEGSSEGSGSSVCEIFVAMKCMYEQQGKDRRSLTSFIPF